MAEFPIGNGSNVLGNNRSIKMVPCRRDERNSLVYKYMQGARKVTKKNPSKKYYLPVRYIRETFRFPGAKKKNRETRVPLHLQKFLPGVL